MSLGFSFQKLIPKPVASNLPFVFCGVLTCSFIGLMFYNKYSERLKIQKEISSLAVKNISASTLLEGRDIRTFGAKDPDFILVEFGDYQCNPCRMYQKKLTELFSTHKKSLGFSFFNYPLTKIHPNARQSALLEISSRKSPSHWSFHDELFSTDVNDIKNISSAARKFNVTEDMRAKSILKQEIDMGNRLGVLGTPSFFLVSVAQQKIYLLKDLDDTSKIISEL